MPDLTRRKFLALSALALPATLCAGNERLRAAVVGHTGKGDYGHGLDVIFNDLPNVEVVAVADPVEAGRQKAAERSHAARQYGDYREMLAKERLNLVSVAPRWTDEHFAMCQGALEAGAHVISEKPFTQTLGEADKLLALARSKQLKIAVAHQMRLSPSVRHLKSALEDGLIGELLEVRAHGKQDARAGGEDLLVLGTHLFDLMRLFAGDALWCTARILQSGKEVTAKDVRKATEGIGLILGDDIEAQFAFGKGVTGSFTSRAKARETAGHWGLHLIGSKGVVRVLADVVPTIYLAKGGDWTPEGRADRWQSVEGDPTRGWTREERGFGGANRRLVQDWLSARDEPVCSGFNGMKAVEMAHAIFAASLKRTRVALPLANREHPLNL